MLNQWCKRFIGVWKQVSEFEARESRAWDTANPVQKEARAAERMKAYETLAFKTADGGSQK